MKSRANRNPIWPVEIDRKPNPGPGKPRREDGWRLSPPPSGESPEAQSKDIDRDPS